MLRAAMDELRQQVPAENYRLLEMRFLEGRSEAETGAALGLTAEQVRHRKYRLMQRLQTLLKVYTGQETDEATPQE